MLSGGIPHELSELTYLEVFNVSHNNLVAAIPEGGQFSTFDSSSVDRNSGLCGSPLSKMCRHTDEAEAPPMTDNDREMNPSWLTGSSGCWAVLVVLW